MFLASEDFSDARLDANRELGLVTHDGALIAPLARVVRGDFAGARPCRR